MKTTINRFAFLAAILLLSGLTRAAHAEKYALLVGVTKLPSAPRDKWLNGPANDVELMRSVLTSKLGYKDENIMTVGGTAEGADATASNIASAFRSQLINKCKPGDYALFYYSGHGTQIPDPNGDEADGKDEAIVPRDAANTIESYITDDQLGTWTGQIRAKETLVILDSCHSGTGLRGGATPKFIDADDLGFGKPAAAKPAAKAPAKPVGAPAVKAPATKPTAKKPNAALLKDFGASKDFQVTSGFDDVKRSRDVSTNSNVILLSGCRSDQTSADYPFLLSDNEAEQTAFLDQIKNDKYCVGTKINPFSGALTFMTLNTIMTSKEGISYTELAKAISLKLQKNKFDQEPQLEGSRLDTPAFGTSEAPAAPPAPAPAVVAPPVAPPTQAAPPTPVAPPTQAAPVQSAPVAASPASAETLSGTAAQVISVAGDTAQISVGAGLELVPNSIFESASGAALRVISSQSASGSGTNGTARVVRGTVRAGEKLNETFHFVATKKLRVALLGDAPGGAKSVLSQKISALDFVQIVEARVPHDAELEFSSRGDGLRLNIYRNQQQLPAITGADVAEVFPKIGRVLENLYTVNQLVGMENPKAAMKVDLLVNGKDFDTIKVNDTVSFTARAERDCYLYLVDVDPAGKVTVLFPNKYVANNQLRAGQTTNLPAPDLYRLRVAGPAGGEAVKAIVTATPLRLEVLEAAGGEIATLQGGGATIATALLAQLKRELNGGARGIEVLPPDARNQPITTEGWATDIVLLTVKD